MRPTPALACCLLLAVHERAASADELAKVIDMVKPSVVGIGNFQRMRTPPVAFVGTGFVIDDGLTVITAAHVVQDLMSRDGTASLGVLINRGETSQFRTATILALDQEHDLAQLRIGGTPLPSLRLGDSSKVTEGAALAFTGFPLGMVLGLHHVTHRGMVSAITPVAIPSTSSSKLDLKLAHQLGKPAFAIFQLDGTAYPGSSGSPLYDASTGEVFGVINMVYVKSVKEAAISSPSGITYAIPSNFISDMLRKK
jgi:S1-C subfamily serine protease